MLSMNAVGGVQSTIEESRNFQRRAQEQLVVKW
jgi:hypothetical protein